MTQTSSFTIFPAIDLRGGKVVRLSQGDPNKQTTYGDDPQTWAETWKDKGATWLHIINLSGAFEEDARANLAALAKIARTGCKVEFGGGLRNQKDIQAALEMGVERIFLGTAAIKNPDLVDWALERYGAEKIAGDIGSLNGKVAIKGWQETTPLLVEDIGRQFFKQGMRWCVLTDVSRDGTGDGVNTDVAVELQQSSGLQVVASGGVSTLADVRKVREAGLKGVIIGRALYDGKLILEDALKFETGLARDD